MAFGNIRKAYSYLKRNGIEDTFYASVERLVDKQEYNYLQPPAEVLERQRQEVKDKPIKFSIIVPAYETSDKHIRACIESVLAQTYGRFELIIADASKLGTVRKAANSYKDYRIKYIQLSENKGISENTNAGIRAASGEYVGLLDHDDMLTPDCLYEYATYIEKNKAEGIDCAFVYSDEDKCDSDGKKFFEPNFKPGFNPDLLLTNNYICHFLVMKTSLIKELKLRSLFDGAQDHDLVLRAYALTRDSSDETPITYGHISKVLYHWRSHEASTAANPASKTYAYEAGKRAVSDFLKKTGVAADVRPTKHNGFYRVDYRDEIIYPKNGPAIQRKRELTAHKRGLLAYNTFLNRYDIGAIGGPVIKDNKIVGGIMDSTKTCIYDGMNVKFSGYMHRAKLQQNALYLDVRNMMVTDDLGRLVTELAKDEDHLHLFDRELIAELEDELSHGTHNSPYVDISEYLAKLNYDDIDYLDAGIALSRNISMEGYQLLYDPEFLF